MRNARDAVIVQAVRTPVGRRNGALSGVNAIDLSAHVLVSLAQHAAIDPARVDDVIWGCVQQIGEQSLNIGRNAVLSAGWPESVPSTTVDRQCGSSQQSVHFAAAGVIAGHYDMAVAGGVEMMSRIPMGSSRAAGAGLGEPITDFTKRRFGVESFSQGHGAELMASRWDLSRARLDEYALGSHRKTTLAIDEHRFTGEIVPYHLPDGTIFDTDEGVRRDTTLEKLAQLSPAFQDDGVIHAGNASQISDGAAALLITTSGHATQLGLQPIARIHTAVVAGDDPVIMLSAPIAATRKALKVSGLSLNDIGAFEVNEAFAPVPLAWLIETGADERLLNPNGGAIAIGHPLGASGARIMTSLLYHMKANRIRYGLQTMCEAGGMANVTILELLTDS
jgi:acetyl-CoA acyltransferase